MTSSLVWQNTSDAVSTGQAEPLFPDQQQFVLYFDLLIAILYLNLK